MKRLIGAAVLGAATFAIATFGASLVPQFNNDASATTKTLIYRVTGVKDSGDPANNGVATAFICTNVTGAAQTLYVAVYDYNNMLIANKTIAMGGGGTVVATTHLGELYTVGVTALAPDTEIDLGKALISATTVNVHCTSMVYWANSTSPQGLPLHMVRFSPMPESTE